MEGREETPVEEPQLESFAALVLVGVGQKPMAEDCLELAQEEQDDQRFPARVHALERWWELWKIT